MNNQPLIFIKIGGSLITDKTKPYSVREKALKTICQEVKKAQKLGKQLIIGHGGGSFPHVPAKKYQTHKGILNDSSYRGISEVANAAARLNMIVIDELLKVGANAISISPRSMMTAKKHQLNSLYTDSLEEALRQKQLPVLFGDQILDSEIGCTIFSTEKVLSFLALHFKDKGYQVEQIIHCGQTNGAYDLDGNTIPEINSSNFNQYKQALNGSNGVDVTGGMIHKVEETLELAKKGIPGLIIDGIEHGTLSKAIQGEQVIGTHIRA